jgi:hypothetical protein
MQEFPCQPGIARRQAGSRVHNYCFDKILAVCARPARMLPSVIGRLPIAVSQLVNLFREFQFLGEHVPGLSHP